ncbi:MAG: amino acid ABC transporter substrate-binding protein [Desulfobacterales bacterium]|nr:amino acid ABC transporter substrate-binding protein [Desulfobacterales bacterium]
MKKFIFCTMLFVLLTSVHCIAETKSFIIGVDSTEYYPMYGYDNGKYTGYARELLDSFAKDSGYSFQYKALPVLRLYNNFLMNQTVDFKYPDNTFWKADLKKGKNVSYSVSVVDYTDGVMVLPENKGKGLNEFKRLGTVLGFTAWEYLDHIKAGKIKEDYAPRYENMIKKTLVKRVDGAYSCVAVLNYQLEKMNKPGALVFDPSLPHTKSSYLLSSVKYPEVIIQFSEWLVQKKAFVDKLKLKYKVGLNLK